jgi:hypothetical protein
MLKAFYDDEIILVKRRIGSAHPDRIGKMSLEYLTFTVRVQLAITDT